MISLLLVDDDPIVVDLMKEIVDYAAFGIEQVYTAGSMREAIAVLEKHSVDIALCDIEMPGGSGLDLIQYMNERQAQIVKVIVSAHNEFAFAQRAVELHCYSYLLKPVTPGNMANLLHRITKEVFSRRSDTHLRAMGRDYVKTLSMEEEVDAVENVRQYIDQHIREDLSVDKLAQMVYMSQNHLTRSFKKRFGKTVIDYIIEHRLALAENMLHDTNKTVTMIADEVGYFDYVYFSKLFKKRFGMTPKEYRLMLKK